MAINFITPNLLFSSQRAGLEAMGYSLSTNGWQSFGQECSSVINLPHQQRKVVELFDTVIPEGLPVCVSSEAAGKRVVRKYFPALPQMHAGTAAAIALTIDTRYKAVLLLTEEQLYRKEVVQHELVHYDQIQRGDVRYTPDGKIQWTKPGEWFEVHGMQDMMIRNKAAMSSMDQVLLHELTKPWEVEAYALTTPVDEVLKMPTQCQAAIRDYLSRH